MFYFRVPSKSCLGLTYITVQHLIVENERVPDTDNIATLNRANWMCSIFGGWLGDALLSVSRELESFKPRKD